MWQPRAGRPAVLGKRASSNNIHTQTDRERAQEASLQETLPGDTKLNAPLLRARTPEHHQESKNPNGSETAEKDPNNGCHSAGGSNISKR